MMRSARLGAILAILTLALLDPDPVRAQGDSGAPLDGAVILDRVQQANAARAAALEAYHSKREYSVFEPGHDADAVLMVSMTFVAPSTKTFTPIAVHGVGWIHRRVFQGLMEAERQAAAGADKGDSAITSDNYDAQFLGTAQERGRDCYLIALLPKRHGKFLFTGKAWIDKEDFGIARLEGEPVKSPSFWVVRSPFVRQYQRIDRFWLPYQDETHSQVRLAGEYVLRIQYADYEITSKR